MKHVVDMKAPKSVRAIAIFCPEGKYIARVIAHWTDYGICYVLVQNFSGSKSVKPGEYGDDPLKYEKRAGGYGYDKFTAALSHTWIDGHELTNDCAVRLPLPEGKEYFPFDFVPPKGYRTANWTANGWVDCYKTSGLGYLRELGYKVIEVL